MNSADEFSGSSSHFEFWGIEGTGIENGGLSGSGAAACGSAVGTCFGSAFCELHALQNAAKSKTIPTAYVLRIIVDPRQVRRWRDIAIDPSRSFSKVMFTAVEWLDEARRYNEAFIFLFFVRWPGWAKTGQDSRGGEHQ